MLISFLEQLKKMPISESCCSTTTAPWRRFHKDRTHRFPYPEFRRLLTEIIESGTRLVLVTEHASRELVVLSGLYPHPEIWGSRGLDGLMPNGDYSVVALPRKGGSCLLRSRRMWCGRWL